MKRLLTVFTLACWSAFLLWFWLSGRVVAYLHPQFHAGVAVAGLVLLALVPLWWWASGEAHDGCGHCACGEGHAHGESGRAGAGALFSFAILLLPVAAATVVSPGEFGEAAVRNRGVVTDLSQLPSAAATFTQGLEDLPPSGGATAFEGEEGVQYFTRGPDGAINLETIDLLFAAEEPSFREQFENQKVAVTGQYIPPEGGSAGGGFDLVRMFVICCAADARPLGISVVGNNAVQIPRMGWVRITGTARFVEKDGRLEPRLEAEKVEQVEAPSERFLY